MQPVPVRSCSSGSPFTRRVLKPKNQLSTAHRGARCSIPFPGHNGHIWATPACQIGAAADRKYHSCNAARPEVLDASQEALSATSHEKARQDEVFREAGNWATSAPGCQPGSSTAASDSRNGALGGSQAAAETQSKGVGSQASLTGADEADRGAIDDSDTVTVPQSALNGNQRNLLEGAESANVTAPASETPEGPLPSLDNGASLGVTFARNNASPDEPTAELGAVEICEVHTLPAETQYEDALTSLQRAVQGCTASHGHVGSGVLRFEVHLPRGMTALQWLRGQGAASSGPEASRQLHPRIYFSPRRSSAPATTGTAAAEGEPGMGDVAGVGWAWRWQGEGGEPLDEAAIRRIQSFLSAGAPRVRALGGSRFDSSRKPGPEWEEFGSYFFMLPRIEMLEAANCNLLACTLAWHCGSNGGGFASLDEAVADAVTSLRSCRPPAAESSPALKVTRDGSVQHLPDAEGWREMMQPVHDSLEPIAASQPAPQLGHVDPSMAFQEYETNGQGGLDGLLAALDGGLGSEDKASTDSGALAKVVLARRSDVHFQGDLDPLALLQTLQERDPRAFQLFLQLESGATFLGSTPELLYQRSGSCVASEAVAGTRPRGPPGDVEKDFWLAFDLLRSPKDHVEFSVVRDWVRDALKGVCSEVRVDTEKSVLKQGAVQHLYGRLSGSLQPQCNDAHLLAALHPTPAVCGHPRKAARSVVADVEPFDRGFYAGPFGWIAGGASEFAVAIRSALVHGDVQEDQPGLAEAPTGSAALKEAAGDTSTGSNGSSPKGASQRWEEIRAGQEPAGNPGGEESFAGLWSDRPGEFSGRTAVEAGLVRGNAGHLGFRETLNPYRGRMHTTVSLFAGVGIVHGSEATSEWQELDLKIRQFETLLQRPGALSKVPNINQLWARLLVEELCRLGINTFCIAPGSRSSPLTIAVAMQPTAQIIPCIDERSLAFWALGYGRATGRPAAVITSSGTAVANLFPAVVEAAQSHVPLLLLTADRPGELRDTGANQTIDQVKMFGDYTMWAMDVPPPDGSMPARVVLTTVDTAVRHASYPSPGPVHLNCQFRDPLGSAVTQWPATVLQGLEVWEHSDAPFTTPMVPGLAAPAVSAGAWLDRLLRESHGLVVVGELRTPPESLAALKIAETLGWPLVPDALSGLKVGAAASERVTVVHHLDSILLDKDTIWPAICPGTVLQLGGRLTSKRTMQFLEWAALPATGDSHRSPTQWMFVDDTPERHDAAHCLSHRLQMAPTVLAKILGKAVQQRSVQPSGEGFCQLLGTLEEAAATETQLCLAGMADLSEIFVAQQIAHTLPAGDALFISNSMPIRDTDAYGGPSPSSSRTASPPDLHSGVGPPIAANRGASGIDGILSTAAGYAFGLRRAVTLLVGDVSFLHDINGLNLLRTGEMRPPVTVVLVNNGGGGIFNFLPIADQVPADAFTQLWATPQNVDLAGMCRAHGIAHQRVTTPGELAPALAAARGLNKHSVVEVITHREANVRQHKVIQAAVCSAVVRALATRVGVWGTDNGTGANPTALSASYSRFDLALQKPLTTGEGGDRRRGLVLELAIRVGAGGKTYYGFGEISPLPGLHEETLLEAEQQLAVLCHLIPGSRVPADLPLMQGRISWWLDNVVGIGPDNLHPSVRCGLEAALLSCFASVQSTDLAAVLLGDTGAAAPHHSRQSQLLSSSQPLMVPVEVNGLLDCSGCTAQECARQAVNLVSRGFRALKVKVARRENPEEDAAALVAIRQAVGHGVCLRADANRGWTLSQAEAFGAGAAGAHLQYIEEPVEDLCDLAALFHSTGILVALDETLDAAMRTGGGLGALPPSVHVLLEAGGLAALVVKPAVVGGFERALEIARWARLRGIKVVISSAFETKLGLSQYAHLARACDLLAQHDTRSASPQQPGARNASARHPGIDDHPTGNVSAPARSFHGLGTADWFLEQIGGISAGPHDAAVPHVEDRDDAQTRGPPSSLSPPQRALHAIRVPQRQPAEERVEVQTSRGRYSFRLLRTAGGVEGASAHACSSESSRTRSSRSALRAQSMSRGAMEPLRQSDRPPMVLLHGFMGQAEDWGAVVAGLSADGGECIAVDLPGHGQTTSAGGNPQYSVEAMSHAVAALMKVLSLPPDTCLVGYSLGARVALHTAVHHPEAISKVVLVSGTAGILDEDERARRAAKDDALAASLACSGGDFVQMWYAAPMWASLRRHPRFTEVLERRSGTDNSSQAAVLSQASPGRALPLWDSLAKAVPHMLFIAGSLDAKFVQLGRRMAEGFGDISGHARFVKVGGAGHAVHLERPEAVVRLVSSFLRQ